MPSRSRKPLFLDKKQVLLERNISQVHRMLHENAMELALLGQIDAARDLVSLSSSSPAKTSNTRPSALAWAWELTGKWPIGKQSEVNLAEVREENETRWLASRVGDDIPNGNTELVMTALLDKDKDALFCDATSGSKAIARSVALVKALDISLDLADRPKLERSEAKATYLADLDERSTDIVGRIAARWGANGQLECLNLAERLWPYYRDGILASALSLEEGEMQQRGEEMIEIYRRRLSRPAAHNPLAKLSLKELLELANNTSLKSKGARRWYEEMGIGANETVPPLFKQPASPAEILALEERLEVSLPADYKEFLSITNGFWTLDRRGIFDGISSDCPLWGSDAVHWVEKDYFQLPLELMEISRDVQNLVPGEQLRGDSKGWDSPFPRFQRNLVVGHADIYYFWLVQPELVAKARAVYLEMLEKADTEQRAQILSAIEAFAGSLQAFSDLKWCFACWGAGGVGRLEVWQSFRAYLDDVTSHSDKDLCSEE